MVTPSLSVVSLLSMVLPKKDGGGNSTGDGALLGLVLWMFKVRNGPKKGLVEGVNAAELALYSVVVLRMDELY